MTISEKNQTFFQKHHKLLAALLAIALPYAGFNGYQDVKKAYEGPPAGDQSVTVNVASMPEGTHDHTSDATIKGWIAAAVATHQKSKQYHEFDQ